MYAVILRTEGRLCTFRTDVSKRSRDFFTFISRPFQAQIQGLAFLGASTHVSSVLQACIRFSNVYGSAL